MTKDTAADISAKYTTQTLIPHVYQALRELALHQLHRHGPTQSLSGTELVHEVFLRLSKESEGPKWVNQRQFYGAAAEAMRRVLIDRIRTKTSLKRGGGHRRVEFDSLNDLASGEDERLIEISEALDVLAESDPEIAELVKMRFFVGMTLEQIAEVKGVTVRTVTRHWSYARAWLSDHLASVD